MTRSVEKYKTVGSLREIIDVGVLPRIAQTEERNSHDMVDFFFKTVHSVGFVRSS